MESLIPKFALNGGTNESDRTNMFLLSLSEVSTGAVSLVWTIPKNGNNYYVTKYMDIYYSSKLSLILLCCLSNKTTPIFSRMAWTILLYFPLLNVMVNNSR